MLAQQNIKFMQITFTTFTDFPHEGGIVLGRTAKIVLIRKTTGDKRNKFKHPYVEWNSHSNFFLMCDISIV
jgi:hypothetical protein